MGRSIGLLEPEPSNIIASLSRFSRKSCKEIQKMKLGFDVYPAVQYGNESDFYFDDQTLLNLILENLFHHQGPPVYPYIHATSQHTPLSGSFIEKMAQLLPLAVKFKSKNICVHLPVEKCDNTHELVELLTSYDFLRLLEQYPISLDLENNWHDSWFGFSENIKKFFDLLEKKLDEKAKKDLFHYFGITFDSGHFFAQYDSAGRDVSEGLTEFFRVHGSKIRTLHLHGNDGSGDQHLCFTSGIPSRSEKFLNYQNILLQKIQDLELFSKSNMDTYDIVIISEIGSPFTWKEFKEHTRLIFKNI